MHVVCFSKSCGVYCKTIIGMQINKRNKPVNAFNQRHFKVYHENHFQSNPSFIIISILKKPSHTFLYLIKIRGFEMKSRLPSSARNKHIYTLKAILASPRVNEAYRFAQLGLRGNKNYSWN